MSGSEECQFYSKVGACRHGTKCVRKHTSPSKSKNIILANTPLPSNDAVIPFVKSLFVEIALISPIKEFVVAGNQSPHLKGNVYIAFDSEEDALKVLNNINARWLNEQPVFAHLAPMDTLSRAVCREGDRCQRALDCNYVHMLRLDPSLWTELFTAQAVQYGA